MGSAVETMTGAAHRGPDILGAKISPSVTGSFPSSFCRIGVCSNCDIVNALVFVFREIKLL